MSKMTTIAISQKTKDKIKGIGAKEDTYDDIIEEMYDFYEGILDEHYKSLENPNDFVELKL